MTDNVWINESLEIDILLDYTESEGTQGVLTPYGYRRPGGVYTDSSLAPKEITLYMFHEIPLDIMDSDAIDKYYSMIKGRIRKELSLPNAKVRLHDDRFVYANLLRFDPQEKNEYSVRYNIVLACPLGRWFDTALVSGTHINGAFNHVLALDVETPIFFYWDSVAGTNYTLAGGSNNSSYIIKGAAGVTKVNIESGEVFINGILSMDNVTGICPIVLSGSSEIITFSSSATARPTLHYEFREASI